MSESIIVTSTTDSAEKVTAQEGLSKDVEKNEEAKSAPESKDSEQKESANSEAAETEESEEEGNDESDESESDEGTDKSEDSENAKPKKLGGWQRRINKITAARAADKAASQAEIDHWKALALKQSAGEPKVEKVESKSVSASTEPDPDDFETHKDYVKAVVKWDADEREKTHQEKQQKTQLKTEQEKMLSSFQERRQAFAKSTKDFEDVLESVDDVIASPTVQELILSSENGPALMYELAKSREEFERICKLQPLAAAREMGKIEARISKTSESKQETKKLTKTPEPIAPVGSKGSASVKSLHDIAANGTLAEYEAARAKERRSAG